MMNKIHFMGGTDNDGSADSMRLDLILLGLAIAVIVAFTMTGCTSHEAENTNGRTLNVYNWGEYIDPDIIDEFEEETGIQVVYDTFETNEEMYPVIEAGGVVYDAVCPSDYMIEKMIRNGLLQPIQKDSIPELSQIGEDYMDMAQQFDPGNVYAVPYTWGTVGILYNKGMLDEMGIAYPTKWADLWNPALKDEILMQDSVRDAFLVALKKNGFSANSLDDHELDIARDDLILQKPIVQAYVVDQVRDKMIGGESAIGVIYSGEILYIQDELEGTDTDLEYVIPEEGTNLWIDAWVIPKNAAHPEEANEWLNFLCRPDIALRNFEYITYSTPNQGAYDIMDEEYKDNAALFPDVEELLKDSEVFHYFSQEADKKYNSRWKSVKSA